ncbi:MAG TPA: membrane dipeptidase [Candidatus Sulfopaludibacter sp.]|jgi:membrane dipeptidase|nr:membrane dipeptidase [Candidatus Sulfopaludibacter sp.]
MAISLDRRLFLRTAVAAPMLHFGRVRLFGADYSTRAVDLVRSSTVIDMLSPFALAASRMIQLLNKPETFTPADLATYRASGIHAFHIAIGMGGPDAFQQTLQFVALWDGFLAHHSDTLKRIDSAADIDAARAAGKIGVIVGLQNSEHFRTPQDVDLFYSLGQRVSQLTYNARNMIGNGSTERHDEGLSDFGLAIVERMNRVGMAVDVSHCGDRTTLDAFEVSKKPVLITHSNCRVLVNGHPRCKTDEAIKKLAAQGGVMGITGVRMFVKADEPTTIENVLDHFDHVKKLVGAEFLGVGSDIDLFGYDAMPPKERAALHANYKSVYAFREKDDIEGLNHPKRMFDLTEGLIRRGYTDTEIHAILGGNFRRVLAKIWG